MTTWATTAPFPSVRTNAAGVGAGGIAYVIGGQNGNASSTCSYNPATNAWTQLATIPTQRYLLAGAADSSGRIYGIGGQGVVNGISTLFATVERFDPTTGAWSTLAPMATARMNLSAATDSSGLIYAMGGETLAGAAYSNVERFDPATGAWTGLTPMATARVGPASATDSSGRIYACGGSTGGGAPTSLATAERFDPATGAWSAIPSMPAAVGGVGASDSSGRIYVVGSSVLYRFDPALGTWASLTPMPTARLSYAVASISVSHIYAIAGTLTDFTTYVQTVERDTEDSPPYAPTLNGPPNNSTIDLSVTQRFSWTFNDPDAGDSQSAFDLQYRVSGGTTWTTVSSTTPNNFYDFAASTFAAGNWEWQCRTYDSAGLVGPFSGSFFFTAGNAPAQPTITAPTNGATVVNTATLTWSAPNQTDYQYRRVADNAGAADTTTVYYDTGDVVDSSTRSQTVTFNVNNRWEHVQVRVKYAGLWSSWADCRVQVSYTTPMVPGMYLSPDNNGATIAITVINPAPTSGVPAVSYNDVYISSAVDVEYRAATRVGVNATWIWYLPASGRTYTVRIVAVGTNATTSSSV